LLNLLKHSRPDICVTLKPMSDISQLTHRNSHANIEPITSELLTQIQSFDWSKLELYFYLDQILLDHMNQTVKITDLLTHIKIDHTELYNLIFKRAQDIVYALPKT